MKVPAQQLILLAQGARCFRGEDEGDGSGATEAKGRKITMDDGRVLDFGEKTKIQKEHGLKDGNVFARIDFDNGKTIEVVAYCGNLGEIAAYAGDDEAQKETAKHAAATLMAVGHGLVQKLGDAAAGAESTDDAFESILEVATRFSKGDWKKAREGGGSAKGSSELVLALTEYLQQSKPETTKDTVRELLSAVTPQEKAALRKLDPVAKIIERIKAERAPSAKEKDRLASAEALLAGMAEGKLPVREPAAA
jgi:hypothetical protein